MTLPPAPASMTSSGHSHHHDHPPLSDHSTSPPNSTTTTTNVRFMCSSGGKIVPHTHDNQLRYVGGDNHIVSVPRSISASALHSKLCKISGVSHDVSVKYQLPQEDLDALISITTDEDVENMMDEYNRICAIATSSGKPCPRLRVFLFPPAKAVSESVGNKPRQSWFVEALNGGGMTPPALERGRSGGSSALSEMPDYLFGLDSSSDENGKGKSAQPLPDSPFGVADTSAPESPLPPLPPVKTKSEEVKTITIPNVVQQQPNVPSPPFPVYYVPAGAMPMSMPVPFGHPGGIVPPGLAYFVPVYEHFGPPGGGVHVGGDTPVTPVDTTPTNGRNGVHGFA